MNNYYSLLVESKMNNIDPKIDPCGTPLSVGTRDDICMPTGIHFSYCINRNETKPVRRSSKHRALVFFK